MNGLGAISSVVGSFLTDWWRRVDRQLFGAFICLIAIGMISSFAGSPPIALQLDLAPWYFVERHAVFTVMGLALILYGAFCTRRQMRRLALLVLLASLGAMVAVLVVGTDVKGARRWLDLFGQRFQPSEFLKPAVIVVFAWLMAQWPRRDTVPVLPLHVALGFSVMILLILQPDYGQLFLLAMTWGAMVFYAGLHFRWIILLIGLAVGMLSIIYVSVPHVAARIDNYLLFSGTSHYQVEKALEALRSGGWFGAGLGERSTARRIPDSHSDFVFAVISSEYGMVAGLLILLLYAFILWRCFLHAFGAADPFRRLAILGLATLFGFQALINIGVNLGLLPATGMTLPFVSYGGSSMVSNALLAGFLMVLTRHDIGDRDWVSLSDDKEASGPT